MIPDIILLVLAILFLFTGVRLWQKGDHLLLNGKTADAIIFSNNRNNKGMHYPVVRFLTHNKEWITKELSIGYNPAKKEGTKIRVIYDPNDTSVVEIHSRFQLEILPRIFVVMGLFGFILGIFEIFEITDVM